MNPTITTGRMEGTKGAKRAADKTVFAYVAYLVGKSNTGFSKTLKIIGKDFELLVQINLYHAFSIILKDFLSLPVGKIVPNINGSHEPRHQCINDKNVKNVGNKSTLSCPIDWI